LLDRLAAHRSARIEEDNQVTRDGHAARRERGWHDRQQAVRGVFRSRRSRLRLRTRHVERQPDLRLAHGPSHHHVAIERRPFPRELHEARPVALLLRQPHRMRRRFRLFPARNRVTHRQRDRHARRNRSIRDVHRHALRVGHVAAEIPRRGRRWEAPLPRSLVHPREALIDGQLHFHRFAGRHVPELLREEARPLLIEEGRRLSFEQRLFESLARRFTPVHLADDALGSDGERVPADRAALRERK